MGPPQLDQRFHRHGAEQVNVFGNTEPQMGAQAPVLGCGQFQAEAVGPGFGEVITVLVKIVDGGRGHHADGLEGQHDTGP